MAARTRNDRGQFLYHTSCPSCGSRDNLAVYTDGSWCFGCSYRTGKDNESITSIKEKLMSQIDIDVEDAEIIEEKNNKNVSVAVPTGFTTCVSDVGLTWLRNYQLTPEEIAEYRIEWHQAREALLFPIYDAEGNLIFYQLKNFKKAQPKYQSCGASGSIVPVFGLAGKTERTNVVTIVEDFISAIKVARRYPCMPLFGSTINPEKLNILADRFKHLVVWLDPDKKQESGKIILEATQYFESTRSIITTQDPKYYTQEQIVSHWLKGRNSWQEITG